MSRIADRIARLEAVANINDGFPEHIFGLASIPEALGGGEIYLPEEIQDWLDSGAAQLAFDGQAILYTGTPDNAAELTPEEWLARYAPQRATA